jgi:hypothetical protein
MKFLKLTDETKVGDNHTIFINPNKIIDIRQPFNDSGTEISVECSVEVDENGIWEGDGFHVIRVSESLEEVIEQLSKI